MQQEGGRGGLCASGNRVVGVCNCSSSARMRSRGNKAGRRRFPGVLLALLRWRKPAGMNFDLALVSVFEDGAKEH